MKGCKTVIFKVKDNFSKPLKTGKYLWDKQLEEDHREINKGIQWDIWGKSLAKVLAIFWEKGKSVWIWLIRGMLK